MRFSKLKSLFLTVVMAISFGGPMLVPALASASAASLKSDACSGLSELGTSGTGCTSGKAQNNNPVYGIVGAIIKILSLVVGIAAVIAIIAAGLQYVTSGGDSAKVTSAKNTLIYALIGIVVAVAAQLLTHIAILEGNTA